MPKSSTMKKLIIICVSIFLTACAGTPVKNVPKLTAQSLASTVKPQSIELATVISRIPINRAFYEARYGMLCELAGIRRIPSETVPILPESLQRGFRETLEPLGFKIAKKSETAFGKAEAVDLLVGATIVDFESTLCHGLTGRSGLNAGAPDFVKGKMYIEVIWEIYRPTDNTVIYSKSVPASFEADSLKPYGVSGMLFDTFIESLKNLTADQKFRNAIEQLPVAKEALLPKI
jgi:hypothetical protein